MEDRGKKHLLTATGWHKFGNFPNLFHHTAKRMALAGDPETLNCGFLSSGPDYVLFLKSLLST